jgi:quercetin dioxygenase-like cupin family protein/catechol 2,3-dioxygenase-like lactoylglutathione lyase family enzyme
MIAAVHRQPIADRTRALKTMESQPPTQLVVPCSDLDAALKFYVDRLGFRLDMIMPADAPRVARVSGAGICLRLEQGDASSSSRAPIRLRLSDDYRKRLKLDAQILHAPDQVVLEFEGSPSLALALAPVSEAIVQRLGQSDGWGEGRAGMQYRDLIPGRLQGQVIASHIRIPEGGPVEDYVHFHKVGVQLIYCRRGWVKVVYEDQGPPFVMQAGDCVLQPPTIRHRVLESSPGLEVIELGSPAEHETWRDHDMSLPNGSVHTDRLFQGQRFVLHVAADASWENLGNEVETRDTGIGGATSEKAGARVLRFAGTSARHASYASMTGDFRFVFVLEGRITLDLPDAKSIELSEADACVLPDKRSYTVGTSSMAEVLEISFPAI